MMDMPMESTGPDDYKKRQDAIRKKLAQVASKGGEILKTVSKEEFRDTPALQDNCQMVHMLVSEGLEMYRDGDMTLKEFVEDLNKSLLALLSVTEDEPGKKSKHKEMMDEE